MSHPTTSGSGSSSTSLSPKTIIGLALAAVVLILILQNTGEGTFRFLVWALTAPAWVWFLTVFVAGGAVGSLLTVRRGKKK